MMMTMKISRKFIFAKYTDSNMIYGTLFGDDHTSNAIHTHLSKGKRKKRQEPKANWRTWADLAIDHVVPMWDRVRRVKKTSIFSFCRYLRLQPQFWASKDDKNKLMIRLVSSKNADRCIFPYGIESRHMIWLLFLQYHGSISRPRELLSYSPIVNTEQMYADWVSLRDIMSINWKLIGPDKRISHGHWRVGNSKGWALAKKILLTGQRLLGRA